jgi:hypothetical protein
MRPKAAATRMTIVRAILMEEFFVGDVERRIAVSPYREAPSRLK